MITNYIPDTCKYSVNNLRKVVHIFSESLNKIYIDNGEAYVTSGITDFQTLNATSVEFSESTSYDDRFKFEKTVTVTVDGFTKLNSLNERYYVVLQDENNDMWLVNADFPSFVTYSYTLADGADETTFTFSALSNFPTLRFTNLSLTYSHICEAYKFPRIGTLMIAEKDNAVRNAYKFVNFNEGSLKLEESYDGTNVTTNIQFTIDFDDYQSSWHYNLLEYPDNKYVVKVGNLTCGLEMGLVPSYSVQGSHQMNTGDKVTITLTGTSLRGSEYSEITTDYIWVLTDDWRCSGTKWIATYADGHTEAKPCDTTSAITAGEINVTSLVTIEINSECVNTIGDAVFMNATSLSSATIPDGITAIGNSAFTNCISLTDIIIPDGITAIGNNVFTNCSALTEILLPDSIISIGTSAFSQCSSLVDITIPSGVTSIGTNAFDGCTGLTGITCLATTPPTLGSGAFDNTNDCPIYVPCDAIDVYKSVWGEYENRLVCIPFGGRYKFTLIDGSVASAVCNASSAITIYDTYRFNYRGRTKSIEIGECVTTIPSSTGTPIQGVFMDFDALTSVHISNSVTNIGTYAFYGCNRLSTITIPDNVTSIGHHAFWVCDGLTSVSIGTGLTSINNYTFSNCASLTSINIPNSVTSVGEHAFSACTSLPSIDIPDSVTSIGEWAFFECSSLTSCTIGSGVTSISKDTFRNCYSLTSVGSAGSGASVEIPSTVTSIGVEAFYWCTGLTGVSLTNVITNIDKTAFNECNSLTYLYIDTDAATTNKVFEGKDSIETLIIDDNVTTITGAFYGCGGLTSVSIGTGLTSIGENAFHQCTSLPSIDIPGNITSIEKAAFERCYSLTSVTIGNGATSIGAYAFYQCSDLTNVTIGSGCTYIGYQAFADCSGPINLTIYATTPPYILSNAFQYSNINTIYVPAESINAYKSAPVWAGYADRIQAIP